VSRCRISSVVPPFILCCGQDDKGNVFWFSEWAKDFSLLRNFETRSGAKLFSYSMDPGVNFSGERVGGMCEVDHSIPFSVEVNNECSYIPTRPYGFTACAGTTSLFFTSEALKCKDRTKTKLDCVWNVMAHTQKPDFVFRRNGRVHLNRRGRQFTRLLAAEVCASAVVMLDTPCSEVV